MQKDSFLLDLEKIKSNSKNHFKFGNDCTNNIFSSIGCFKKKRAGNIFLV
jgi:hypothetical protein